jgi:hypothetical protein
MGEEQIAFFYWIGDAITSWAFVENELQALVELCIDPGPNEIALNALRVGFLSIEGFRSKMDFAEGLIARRFPAQKDEWGALVARIRALSRKRNWLAHWKIRVYERNDPGRRFTLGPWIFPEPHHRQPPKRPIPPKGSIGVREIVKYSQEFTACAMTMNRFGARLAGRPEPFPKSVEQPEHPPTMAALKAQIREELARLLEPSGE